MELYVMTRNGGFTPKKHTKSQCSRKGTQSYNYQVRLAFSSDVNLDDDDMIIDHTEIDKAITTLQPVGSCEVMHPAIFDAVKNTLDKKDIELAGYKCTITSGPNEGAAFMEYYYFNENLPNNVQKCVRAILK